MSEDRTTLLEFPCRFPFKIMGAKDDAFAATMLAVVQQHAPKTTEVDVIVRESSNGNFLSLTVTITATSKDQLDNIYRALSSHPMVKFAL